MRATHLPTAARHCSSEIGMSPAQTEEADKVERGHPQFVNPITPHISWISRRAKSSLSEAQILRWQNRGGLNLEGGATDLVGFRGLNLNSGYRSKVVCY